MSITLKYFFSKPVTLQYPHEMKNLPERTRGTLILYADTEKMKIKCTVCLVCEVVCPNNSIHIDFVRDPENKKKYIKKYYWDADKCIYCGLCEEACPVDAIVEGPNFEYATETREELLYDKEKLLANGDRWETEIAERLRANAAYR
ncbi:MAG: NADH-quinone oxidoreductase subunit NuoI [Proteobacteria bacterium]|nr:NADH-quinone oxidoreductase subunit NuoI [Pseudomonadota bacterium]